MAIVSTVGPAIAVLAGYFDTVAAGLPGLNIGVYTGLPVENVAENFLMVGDYPNGDETIVGYEQRWAAMGASAGLRSEEYSIACCLRAWSGDSDPAGRLSDAFSMFDAVARQLVADPGGSAQLTPSGSWGAVRLTMPVAGPIGGAGWGVVLAFDVEVINAQLTLT